MIQIFAQFRAYKSRFAVAITASTLNKVLDLMPPILVAWVIDTISRQPPLWIQQLFPQSKPFEIAIFLASLAVFIFGFESVFQWAYKRQFMNLAQDIQHDLRMRTYNRIQSRELAFFENHRLGETLAILNDDVNQLERFLNEGFNEIIQLIVLFCFAGSVMFVTSWELALFALSPIPFILIGSLWYQSLISPKFKQVREKVGELNSRLENNISGMTVIKSFSAEPYETQRVMKCSNNYKKANSSVIQLNALYVPLIRMIIAVGFAGVLLIGGYWILTGSDKLSIGELVLFSMMIQRVLWPLTRMGTIIDDFERASASANRLDQLFQTESSIQDPPAKLQFESIQGKLSLNNVSFHYANNIPILSECDMHISPKETVGIAGITGSGKTTLIKLILRLYDPNSGNVTIDDIPISMITLRSLRQQIALVSQDVYLFHGTIFENIAYGQPNSDAEQVERAAKQAELHSFVNQLPDGYQTIVGERGIKLSGGQRQRLSIARAILKNAPIMIFDEATSSVDTETERAIQKNIHKLTAGKTALIIAHRLSTIRHADRILVLGNGQILEQGSHEDLQKKKGIYHDLWTIQIGDVQSNL